MNGDEVDWCIILIHNGMARCVELQSAVRTVAARGGELIDSRGYVCTVM
jgi:hypothetical protein